MNNVTRIAQLVLAYKNCEASGKDEWRRNHKATILSLMNDAPSGSGIDSGTKIDLDRCNPDRIVLYCDFHHMDEFGGYDGWTTHEIIITPSLAFGFNVRVTGKDRNSIKDYLSEVYNHWLGEDSAS